MPGRSTPRFLLLPMLIVLVARSAALMYFGAYQGVFAYFGLWDLAASVQGRYA